MMEAGVVVDSNFSPILWHLPEGRTAGSIPDSWDLWEFIWNHRGEVRGFAHSHPHKGTPSPSDTDVVTFAAIEAALGRRLVWWIASEDELVACHWAGPGKHDYKTYRISDTAEPSWVRDLRKASQTECTASTLSNVASLV